MKNLLPIGSVVRLKGGEKRVMIYGRVQKEIGTGKIWDYIGCYYPEGNIDSDKNFLFNQESIEVIYFIGFQDTEEFEFQKVLREQYKG